MCFLINRNKCLLEHSVFLITPLNDDTVLDFQLSFSYNCATFVFDLVLIFSQHLSCVRRVLLTGDPLADYPFLCKFILQLAGKSLHLLTFFFINKILLAMTFKDFLYSR